VPAAAVIDESSLDFGEVPVGEWRNAYIHVRNIGYVPFNAIDALKIGTDSSFHVDLDPGRVQPGEARPVRVRFHPLKEGGLSFQLKVQTDADRSPDRAIPVRGVGTPAQVIVSPAVADFQNVEIDSDRTLEIKVHNPVDIPLTAAIIGGGDSGDFSSDTVTISPQSDQVIRSRFFPRTLGARRSTLEVRACEDCTPAKSELVGRSVASALEFNPAPVPFEQVPVHERSRSMTRVKNITWRPVQVAKLTTTDVSFIPVSPLEGQTIAPEATSQLEMDFAARFDGPLTGTLKVDYVSNKERSTTVMLDATGGWPALALTPAMIDFGELPVGGKIGRKVRLSNAGSRGQLHFKGVRASGGYADFSISTPSRGTRIYSWNGAWPNLNLADLPIDPGSDYIEVTVYFKPDRAGDLQANLTFITDDLFNPERTIPMSGRAYDTGPCSYRILPERRLDFGNVPPGDDEALGFRFENIGDTVCAVRDIHLSNDGGGVFYLPGGDIAGGVLWPGDAFAAMVAFRPPRDGIYSGEVKMNVSNPANPFATLPLIGVSHPSCLVAAPRHLDFGQNRLDCPVNTLSTRISNQCVVPITATGAEIGPGTSDQYSIVNPPTFPIALDPGSGFEIRVAYQRRILGQHYSPLFVRAQGEATPFLVPLWAQTDFEGIQVDKFIQGVPDQLDVLFVESNTTTMGAYQARLRAAIPNWISTARTRGVEIHVGVTSTGLVGRNQCPAPIHGGEAGRIVPIDGSRPRVVSSTLPEAVSLLQQNLDLGTCHNLMQGLETMRQALSPPLIDHQKSPWTPEPNDGNLGLLRPPAQLAVVVLADEDDHSGFDPASYAQFIRSIKGVGKSQRSSVSAIVPTDPSCTTAGPPGTRFSAVAQQTGGGVLSVCSSDYGSILDKITTRAAGPQRDFHLFAQPISEAEISVKVSGVPWEKPRWSYDPVNNAIVFAADTVPAPGEEIEVRYRSLCSQQL
jgi:hypothetical protein